MKSPARPEAILGHNDQISGLTEIDRLPGLFGPIRVLRRDVDGGRFYLIESSLQALTTATGESLFGYIHGIKLLLVNVGTVLIIGGAAGSLATMMARTGAEVTVVEIDPAAHVMASLHFGLDPRVTWITADGATYLRTAQSQFDAIVVDACGRNGTIAAFATAAWLAHATTNLSAAGQLIVNLARRPGLVPKGKTLARALSRRGLHCRL